MEEMTLETKKFPETSLPLLPHRKTRPRTMESRWRFISARRYEAGQPDREAKAAILDHSHRSQADRFPESGPSALVVEWIKVKNEVEIDFQIFAR